MEKQVRTNGWVKVKGFEADGREETYVIVPPDEADVLNSKIPEPSPLARALLGARVGDTVFYEPPAGPVELTVVNCGSLLDQPHRPSKRVLYHCQTCGHVASERPGTPSPVCCGKEMAYAAEETV